LARDEDGAGFCEVDVNTPGGFWSLLRSWLRPHREILQERLPLYLGFFEFVHNARRRGKALLGALLGPLLKPVPRSYARAGADSGAHSVLVGCRSYPTLARRAPYTSE